MLYNNVYLHLKIYSGNMRNYAVIQNGDYMKRKLLTILTCVALSLITALGMVGCGGAGWDNSRVTLKTITKQVGENGGMVCQTENYIYFINGVGDSKANNDIGTPIKSALYAIDKGDFTKQSIIVPKLFVSTDYKAGVYIYGEYVYYGTTSTDKNSEGNIANDELVIAKTKLDGSSTEILLNVGSLSTEFRVSLGKGDKVFVTYYDSKDTAIKCFDTVSKETTIVAKTDEKTNGESLKEYKFLDNGSLSSAVVVFSTTSYALPYNEEDAKDENYQRAEKLYNAVYAYKPGDEKVENSSVYGVKALNGDKTIAEQYTLTKVVDNNLFYSVAKHDNAGKTTRYAISVNALYAQEIDKAVKITNEDALTATVGDLIISLDKAYYLDDTAKMIKETTLVGTTQEINENTKIVAKGDSVSKLLFVLEDYLYYIDSGNVIQRVYIGENKTTDALKNVQRVSAGETNKSYYEPKLVKVGEKDILFYVDASKYGCSYLAYANLDSAVTEEDTDDNDENDLFYLSETALIGEMENKDTAKVVEETITAIADSTESSGKLKIDKDAPEGQVQVKAIEKARALLDSYNNSAVKDLVSEDKIKTLEKYEKAYEISKKLYALKDFQTLSDGGKNALETKFNEAKAYIEKFFNEDTSENHSEYEAVLDMVVKDLNYQYGKAKTYFAEKNK